VQRLFLKMYLFSFHGIIRDLLLLLLMACGILEWVQRHRSPRMQKWQLRVLGGIPQGGPLRLDQQNSFREFQNDVQHAATETYLITQLALTLLRYLGIGSRWISKFLLLCLYTLFLMPGFLQVLFKYYFSNYIHRSIVYGMEPRNR
jgi:hypothetical protein